MVVSCVYYGLTLNAADLGGDPFINLFLSGIVEVPSAYLAVVLLEKWGRRPTLCSTLIFGGASCICMMFVPKGKYNVVQPITKSLSSTTTGA